MDGSYQLLAAQYVRKQTRQLMGQLDGARKADDIECVHQARVASRRLRAGLRVFPDCFSRKKVRRWRKTIRRLAQGLGTARDKDVQTEFVRGVLSGLTSKEHRPGIARLLLRLEQDRRAIQPRVVKAVDRFQASGVAAEMLAAAKRLRSKLKKRGLSLQSPFVFRQAERHILNRLNGLIRYEDCLSDVDDQERHHAMRIEAKRLRYTTEIYQPIYEGRLDEFVRAAKELQTLLGEIHDCDVWVEHLPMFLEEERERTLAYFGHVRPLSRLQIGLEHLRQERGDRRKVVFDELVGHWRQLNQQGFWEELVRTVQQAEQPSARLNPQTGSPSREPGRGRGAVRAGGDGRPPADGLPAHAFPAVDGSPTSARPDDRPAPRAAALRGPVRPERP